MLESDEFFQHGFNYGKLIDPTLGVDNEDTLETYEGRTLGSTLFIALGPTAGGPVRNK